MPNLKIEPVSVGIGFKGKRPNKMIRSLYPEGQKWYDKKKFTEAPKDSVLYVPQESYVVFENDGKSFKFVTTDGAGPCAAIAIVGGGKTFFTHLDDNSSDLGKVKDSLHGMITRMLDMVSQDHSEIESISVVSAQVESKGTMAKALVEDLINRDNLGAGGKPCILSTNATKSNLTMDLETTQVVCCADPPFPAVEEQVEAQIINKNVLPLNHEKDISKKLEELGKYKFPDDVVKKLIKTGKTITIMEEVNKEKEANQQQNNEESSFNDDVISAGDDSEIGQDDNELELDGNQQKLEDDSQNGTISEDPNKNNQEIGDKSLPEDMAVGGSSAFEDEVGKI